MGLDLRPAATSTTEYEAAADAPPFSSIERNANSSVSANTENQIKSNKREKKQNRGENLAPKPSRDSGSCRIEERERLKREREAVNGGFWGRMPIKAPHGDAFTRVKSVSRLPRHPGYKYLRPMSARYFYRLLSPRANPIF